MENKYNLSREQNIFIAKRNIVDYIWKSANLEGINVTYLETQVIYDGGVVNGLTVDNIIAINNLKYAWQFILESENLSCDFKLLTYLHKLTCDKLVLNQDLGKLRTTPVNIGGTNWKPQFPIESQIIEELEMLLKQNQKTKTEIAIEVMLWIMRRQMFIDGNKRVGMLFANKIMIDNGCGIITISQKDQPTFFEKLIRYYETGDNTDLKEWIYDTSIDGIKLNTNN
ncbi:MAG: Fic family protein [Bacilli bacterium]